MFLPNVVEGEVGEDVTGQRHFAPNVEVVDQRKEGVGFAPASVRLPDDAVGAEGCKELVLGEDRREADRLAGLQVDRPPLVP